jgi:hypothetical protein
MAPSFWPRFGKALVSPQGRIGRTVILAAGLLLPPAVLYAPSLSGQKLLLPLDYLEGPGVYLPPAPQGGRSAPRDAALGDEVTCFEPWRRFAAGEFHAGRVPLWNPSVFTGAPFVVLPTYSPFNLLYMVFASPVTLAWTELLKSVLAGWGAYLFFRKALGAGFWPAAVGAWCYPLTAFFIFWQGFYVSCTTVWFPWQLVAVEGVVRRPGGWAGPGLAVVTGLLLVSGALDVALQALLLAGLYALGRIILMRPAPLPGQRVRAIAVLAAGWLIGLFLPFIQLLPLYEYVQTGVRMAQRAAGTEERPPVGVAALPLLILPDAYGRSVPFRDAYLGPVGSQLESPATGYAGLLAALVAAPLAWRRPDRRPLCWLLLGLAVFALGWTLNIPGLVQLFRLPGLNMMSGNRFVFASAFLVQALAVLGLDSLASEPLRWRPWFFVPLALVVLAAAWCAISLAALMGALGSAIPAWLPHVQAAVATEMEATLVPTYVYGLVLLALAMTAWGLMALRRISPPMLGAALGILMFGELLVFIPGRNPQCDPALYYPPLPVLEAVAHSSPGRSLGIFLPFPNIHEFAGLRELRGYDAVDPARIIAVLDLARLNKPSPGLAHTIVYQPALRVTPDHRLFVHPVLNMLNLRYLIVQQHPERYGLRSRFEGQGYYVVENRDALPRAFLPRRVEVHTDGRAVLMRLAATDFDPTAVAYIDQPLSLPEGCRGTAEIVEDLPCRVTVRMEADRPGLLVLADQWYPGWNATVNGAAAPVVIANYALRGVPVPAGTSEVVFRYAPRSFTNGVLCSAIAGLAVLAWITYQGFKARTAGRSPAATASAKAGTKQRSGKR